MFRTVKTKIHLKKYWVKAPEKVDLGFDGLMVVSI
jgi:hypothetical protein